MSKGAVDPVRRNAAIVVCLLAASLSVLSLFGPTLDNPTLDIRDNRLIEHWSGLVVLGCAAFLIFAAYGLYRGKRMSWLVCAVGMAIIALVIYEATGSRLIVAENGIGGEAPITGTVGLGLFLTGCSGLMAIVAGLIAWDFAAPRARRRSDPQTQSVLRD
jgi:hypothetical protein